MGCIEKLMLASVLLGVYTNSVTGITMTVTPSSNTLWEGQSLTILCSKSHLPNPLVMKLFRNNERMVTFGVNSNQPTWDSSYTGPNYQSRAEVTGSVTSSAASLNFVLSGTQCADSAMFHCRVVSLEVSEATPPQNITIYGVLKYPTMTGGRVCNTFDDSDCNQCNPDDKFVRKGDMLELVCEGQVGLPQSFNTYSWYIQNDRDFRREEITENITTQIFDPTTTCYTAGRSTLRYYPNDLHPGLLLTCEVTYDNRLITGGEVMSTGANTSVCTEAQLINGSPRQNGHSHLIFILSAVYLGHWNMASYD